MRSISIRAEWASLTTVTVATIAIVAAIVLSPSALAQGGTGPTAPPIVGGPPFIEAWVDPCNGSDALGAVGCPDSPFQTIRVASLAVAGAGVSQATPGLVHCDPGIYGPPAVGGNGEPFPIFMSDFVNLQGVDARRCVIRGDQTQLDPNPAFYPVVPFGTRVPVEVLISLRNLQDSTYEEMIDGFTLQGGHVQVYAETERAIRARISNCVFDMLNYRAAGQAAGVPVGGPNFGILMVHVWEVVISNYLDIPLNILNNTFIQGWSDGNLPAPITASPGAVAICDVGDTLANDPVFPVPPATPDPNPVLRGVGNPNIQNNLIRFLAPFPATALMGIDFGDTTAQVGALQIPSNAFDPAQAVSSNGVYNSRIVGGAPTSQFNPNPATGGTDPAFVGEMLSSLAILPSGPLPTGVSRDWRLLPDSILVDAGVSPVNGTLTAVNQTAYVQTGLLLPESSFDFDGEGYGNLRIRGASTDIGFDETDVMINAGGYGNDTRHYGAAPCPFDCSPVGGIGAFPQQPFSRFLLFPGPGVFSLFETRVPMPYPGNVVCPTGFSWAYSAHFGTGVPPTFWPGLVPGGNILWLDGITPTDPFATFSPSPSVPAGATINTLTGYIPPFDNTPHVVNWVQIGIQSTCTSYINEQAIFLPAGSTGPSQLSNVQSSTE